MNIYAGREFGWGWQEHIDHGYLGGDDMKAVPGERVVAPVAGTVTRTAHSVTITEPDGWKTQCLELESTVSQSSVQVGHGIGFASSKWPHWHSINPDGTRVPARFLHEEEPVTPTPKKADPIMHRAAILTTSNIAYFNGQTYFETPVNSAKDRAWIRFTGAGNPNGISVAEALIYKQTAEEFVASIPGGSGAGGLTTAEHNHLFDIPTKAETAALHTAQTGDINAHTTEAVDGITLTAAP